MKNQIVIPVKNVNGVQVGTSAWVKERLNGESSININRAFYYMIKVTLSMMIGCFRKIS